jgi:hypothetical protein
MSITTNLEAGKIVIPPGLDCLDGAVVRIEQVEDQRPSIWDVLKKYEGIATDLPSDMAEKHDHYHSRASEKNERILSLMRKFSIFYP